MFQGTLPSSYPYTSALSERVSERLRATRFKDLAQQQKATAEVVGFQGTVAARKLERAALQRHILGQPPNSKKLPQRTTVDTSGPVYVLVEGLVL